MWADERETEKGSVCLITRTGSKKLAEASAEFFFPLLELFKQSTEWNVWRNGMSRLIKYSHQTGASPTSSCYLFFDHRV